MERYIQYMYSYPHKTAYRTLENINIKDYFSELSGNGHSLYLHVPFCKTKCGYCNLFSITGMDEIYFEKYIDAVIRQMKQYSAFLPKDTIFDDFTIGGGTPLLLSEKQIEIVFESIFKYMPLKKDCKIIIETAPDQTTFEKVVLLKKLGVTRVSIGIQSFNESELRTLGRSHFPESASRAAELLSEAGFECMNFDFIYGIPEQTNESFEYSLKKAMKYSPDEIFMYPLYIKNGSGMAYGKFVPDSEKTYNLYLTGRDFLLKKGFYQHSMRRYTLKPALDFSECGMKSSLSLGCGGRSYLGRLHTCTPYKITRTSALSEIEKFIKTDDFTDINHGFILNNDEIKRRYVIKHMLSLPGISEKYYSENFGQNLIDDFPVLKSWIDKGFAEKKAEFIYLTKEGLGLSDMIGPELISDSVMARMNEWRVSCEKNNNLQRKP